MKKIPAAIKKQTLGLSVLLFLLLSFGLGPSILFGLAQFIFSVTNYYFGVSISFLDYGLLSLIPYFGILLQAKNEAFTYGAWIIDSLILIGTTLPSFSVGLYILTYIGKPSNPLIPTYLITEPFTLYTTLCLGIGILLPFLVANGQK